jgi:putative tryptophan/tyrosine transport system substrate-binding protein
MLEARRREFITLLGGAMVAWPRVARAQQSSMPVVGFLSPTSPEAVPHFVAALRQGLSETGYVEGRNLEIQYRWARSDNDQLPALAADLVRHQVAVIVASFIRASLAAKAATSTIPIVFTTANDPIQFGLVASLNRPGGNATGISFLTAALGEKRLQLVYELVPTATVVAVLVNPNNANAEINVSNAKAAARTVGVRIEVLSAASERDLERVSSILAQRPAGALVILNDPLFTDLRDQIVALAARHRVPAIYGARESVEAGGLMSYGANNADVFRQAGIYVGKILNGAKPADLPVLLPTRFELVINLKTAKALGLTVPPTLIARADEVIE